MLNQGRVRDLLSPFELELTSPQISQMLTYLDLLLRWNRKINLTAINGAEECLTRHFGESLYLERWVKLENNLLDIGSGAGFPGLALKIVFPELATTLLEPVAKKRAFLKEVARACRMESVEVRGDRLEDFVRQGATPRFSSATSRALGHHKQLIPLVAECLNPKGRLILWVSHAQGQALSEMHDQVEWISPIHLPLSREREIWIGTRTSIYPPTS